MLLAEIDSLQNDRGCFASNGYFANFFGLSKDRISKIISILTEKNYIEVKLIYEKGSKNIKERLITTIGYRRKQLQGIGENNYTPIGENAEDNSIVTNNTKITYKKETEASPPEILIPDFDENGRFGWIPELHEKIKIDVPGPDVSAADKKKQERLWKQLRFSEFWKKFKNAKGKAKAEIKFMTLTVEEIETILLVVENHEFLHSLREIQHRPHPITWLNQKRWEDDIEAELKKFKPGYLQKKKSKSDTRENNWI